MSISQEDLAAAIEEIVEEHGTNDLEKNIVEAAEDEGHPLHHEFEWNDSVAAHLHRLSVARALIRKVVYLVHRTPTTAPIVAPYYLHQPGTRTSSKVLMPDIVTNPADSWKALLQEVKGVESAYRRGFRIASALQYGAVGHVPPPYVQHLRRILHDIIDEQVPDLSMPPSPPASPSAAPRPRGGGGPRPGSRPGGSTKKMPAKPKTERRKRKGKKDDR